MDDCRMLFLSILYQLARCLLGLTAVLVRRDLSKDAELLVLRHKNAVLRRRVAWVHYTPSVPERPAQGRPHPDTSRHPPATYRYKHQLPIVINAERKVILTRPCLQALTVGEPHPIKTRANGRPRIPLRSLQKSRTVCLPDFGHCRPEGSICEGGTVEVSGNRFAQVVGMLVDVFDAVDENAGLNLVLIENPEVFIGPIKP
jgi:hypothetical protein